ncbi:MAG: hypothetical protein ACYTGZ_12940 [Planctomycetota bacterium]|jgi:hypothetical protein
MERRAASRELGKANRSIAAIRNFYLANVILCSVVLLLVWLAGAPLLLTVVASGAALFMVAGYVQIQKQPYVWSLIIACIWTVIVAGMAFTGGLGPNLNTFLACAWTLGCWMMLPTTTRVTKLRAQYPDLWVSKKMAVSSGRPTRRKKRARRR